MMTLTIIVFSVVLRNVYVVSVFSVVRSVCSVVRSVHICVVNTPIECNIVSLIMCLVNLVLLLYLSVFISHFYLKRLVSIGDIIYLSSISNSIVLLIPYRGNTSSN